MQVSAIAAREHTLLHLRRESLATAVAMDNLATVLRCDFVGADGIALGALRDARSI